MLTPSNVSPPGARRRDAHRRNAAVNRALRKAYGIGICSVEEIGSNPVRCRRLRCTEVPAEECQWKRNGNGSGHKVRDRLCQIIRQHKLDPELVKAYAVDFCGTKALKDATREQVESFVQHLAEQPRKTAIPCSASSTATHAQVRR